LVQNGVKTDTTTATKSNFLNAGLGQSLKYGDKELKYIGLMQQAQTKDTGSNKTTDEIQRNTGQIGGSIVSVFQYFDHATNLSQRFIMTPRYYQSDESEGHGDGAYEFRALNGTSKLYSEVESVEVREGAHSGEFLITFQEQEDKRTQSVSKNQTAKSPIKARVSATVELSKFSDFMKFEVTLNEIPVGNYVGNQEKEFYQKQDDQERGKDVVIDWEFLDKFSTDNKLWVDSNGLDMHQKKLWHRKDYEMKHTDNVAANFYPVTSAIVVKDKNSDKQVTIMTDRAQAGSAGHRSQKNIELMQNRRHNGFDDYGLFSALNDKDSNNRGIQIKATYQMQIFRTSNTTSSQRKMQRTIDQPLLVSYSKDFLLGKQYKTIAAPATQNQTAVQSNNTSNLLGVNSFVRQSGMFKTSVYAYGQNEVLVRVQNMQDNFDGKGLNMQFDVDEFAQKFFREANYK